MVLGSSFSLLHHYSVWGGRAMVKDSWQDVGPVVRPITGELGSWEVLKKGGPWDYKGSY